MASGCYSKHASYPKFMAIVVHDYRIAVPGTELDLLNVLPCWMVKYSMTAHQSVSYWATEKFTSNWHHLTQV